VHPSPLAITRVQALVRAALVLERGTSAPLVTSPVTGDLVGAADLLRAAARHRVTALLHAERDGLQLARDFGPDLVDALEAAHLQTSRNVALQLLEIRRLLEMFAEAGIPMLVVKGPALAVQSAGSVTARGYGDIDLFIAPEWVEASHLLLADHGWQPRRWGSAVPGSWAWRHIISTFNEVAFDGASSTVDLHWRLDPSHDVLPDFAECWDRHTVVQTDVVGIPTLDVATAFLHTCQHAAKDDWRWLRSLVDVHRLARQGAVRAVLTGPDARRVVSDHVWATLAVTDDLLGLPGEARSAAAGHLGSHRAQVRRARRVQERAAVPDRPAPVAQSLRDLRYRLADSRTPRAVLRAVSATVLPAPSVEGVADRSAWTAVPRLLVRRALWLVTSSARWIRSARRPGQVSGPQAAHVLAADRPSPGSLRS
jgi:putative nucleotidyltransferase-like protein